MLLMPELRLLCCKGQQGTPPGVPGYHHGQARGWTKVPGDGQVSEPEAPPTGVLTSIGKTRLSFSLWHIGPPLPHCRKTWVLSRQLKYLRVAQAKDHSSEVLGAGGGGWGSVTTLNIQRQGLPGA
jgi:hypothetical protein